MSDIRKNTGFNYVCKDALYCVRNCSNDANCLNCNILRENINDGRVLCLSKKQCICVHSVKNIAIATLTSYINHNFNNDIIKDANPKYVMYCYRQNINT